jgi:hypothetical protein
VGLFAVVTVWEIGVILTGNYAFLNYLVLVLGVLLLDDRTLRGWVPVRWRTRVQPAEMSGPGGEFLEVAEEHGVVEERGAGWMWASAKLTVATLLLALIAYDTSFQLLNMVMPGLPLPSAPVAALQPFRIANQYGLFAVMTGGRYEIEFQGSDDGQRWTAYPVRYKAQALDERPRIYAPYQPRFDWNLWFASLGDWQQNEIVPLTEERLLMGEADVLRLFRGDPFGGHPPKYVRAVLWQYWFTTLEDKRATGHWWKRRLLGMYAPELMRAPGGRFAAVEVPDPLPAHQ